MTLVGGVPGVVYADLPGTYEAGAEVFAMLVARGRYPGRVKCLLQALCGSRAVGAGPLPLRLVKAVCREGPRPLVAVLQSALPPGWQRRCILSDAAAVYTAAEVSAPEPGTPTPRQPRYPEPAVRADIAVLIRLPGMLIAGVGVTIGLDQIILECSAVVPHLPRKLEILVPIPTDNLQRRVTLICDVAWRDPHPDRPWYGLKLVRASDPAGAESWRRFAHAWLAPEQSNPSVQQPGRPVRVLQINAFAGGA